MDFDGDNRKNCSNSTIVSQKVNTFGSDSHTMNGSETMHRDGADCY